MKPANADDYDILQGTGAARPYIIAFAVVALLLLVGVATTNVVVNPRHEFAPEIVPSLVPDVIQVKVDALAAMEEPPDFLIMGSSRVLALDPDGFPADWGDGYNLGITSGSIPDEAAVLRYLIREGMAPQRLVLGVDVVQFRSAFDDTLDASRAWETVTSTPRPLELDMQRAVRSLSPAYVKDTAQALWYHVGPGFPEPALTFEPDGQGRWPADERALAAGTFDLDHAIRSQDVAFRAYRDFGDLNTDTQRALLDLIDEARSAGIGLHLYMTPLHPEFQAALDARGIGWRVHHDAIRSMLLRHCDDMAVHDLTDIGSFDGDPDDFRDAWHVVFQNAERITDRLTSATDDCPSA